MNHPRHTIIVIQDPQLTVMVTSSTEAAPVSLPVLEISIGVVFGVLIMVLLLLILLIVVCRRKKIVEVKR